jgi:hypothetical protein
MPPARCSPIWPPRSLPGRTASTVSDNGAVTPNTHSVPRRRRPRCGGWWTPGSTPPTCPVSAPPALTRGRGPRRPGRHRRPVGGRTWMSMPSPSTTATANRTRPRPGRRRSGIIRCWCFGTAPRSPEGGVGRSAAPGECGSNTAADPGAEVGAGVAAGRRVDPIDLNPTLILVTCHR